MRIRFYILVLLLFGLTSCREMITEAEKQDINRTENTSVRPEQEFELGLGESVQIVGTDLRLSFTKLIQDSRCPSNVTCIQAGSGNILMTIVDSRENASTFVLSIPGLTPVPYRDNEEIAHRGNRFQLLRLDPYPHAGQSRAEADFRALLVVRL